MKAEPIRALLLEDDPGDERLLRTRIEQVAPGQFEITCAARLGEALKHLGKWSFDIILTDLDVPDSRGLGTFMQLSAHAPGAPIVVLSGLADEDAAVQAVQQGAQDYLIKGETNGTQIVRSIQHAMERHSKQGGLSNGHAAKKGKVLAFIGAKGGVGTTTVAVNVATSIARQKKQTILVELRPYHGTVLSHLQRKPPAANLRKLLDLGPGKMNAEEVTACLTNTAEPDLRVLFGPQTLEEFGEVEPGQAALLTSTLQGLADFVVLDLPSIPTAGSEAAARIATSVTVVVEREATCTTAAKMLLEVLNGWGLSGRRLSAVLVNREAYGVPMKIPDVRSALGCEILGVMPPAADVCSFAQQSAKPLVLFQPEHIAAAALDEIAGRLVTDSVSMTRLG